MEDLFKKKIKTQFVQDMKAMTTVELILKIYFWEE